MKELKVGDELQAVAWCGFPDHTTEGEVYNVSSLGESLFGRQTFYIIADNGEELMPISTSFKKVNSEG